VTGIWTNAPIPAGTRFGPIQGAKYSPEDAKNPTIDKKRFWRVHDRYSSVKFIIDGKDVTKANWIRHVQPAQGIHQNLVAYQDREEIYFLTVRQIDKDEELFVWYGYDFAKRLQERTSEDNWPVVPSTRSHQAGNYTQQPLSVEDEKEEALQ
jgi:hypothetical protein